MINKLKKGAIALTTLAVSVLATVKAPELHKRYLRNKVGAATVTLFTENSGGSGVHVQAESGKTYILTNKHVCGLAVNGRINVRSNVTGVAISRKVVSVSREHDLCLVQPLQGVDGLSLGGGLEKGDTLHVIGNPRLDPLSVATGEMIDRTQIEIVTGINVDRSSCDGSLMEINDPMLNMFGIFSACITKYDAIQANVIAYPGNSGSAVVDSFGNVEAILFAGSRDAVTNQFLVPLDFIKDFLSNF
jgi:S1-C subfamily serine protease